MLKVVGEKAYNTVEYIASKQADVEDLPKNVGHGSTCFVIENSNVYMFDAEVKEWKQI